MALVFLRLVLFLIPMVFVTKQVILPLLRDDPIFPFFRGKPGLMGNAEKSLADAQTAKKAAEIEHEAARLNKEAAELYDTLYDEETKTDET